MKNIIKPIAGLLILGSMAFTSCTDVEGITINESTIKDRNPEAYAKYLDNLKAYKASGHKVVYAWFDNSNKEPFSPAQHITNMSDSIDVISMMVPELAEFEKKDIETIHQKGTKVFYTISYDDIKAAYDELAADEGNTSLGTFDSYLQKELTSLLAYSADYDGIIAEFSGVNPILMSAADKAAYLAIQKIFLNAVDTWKTENTGKELVFQGKPQNLIDKAILGSCKHIILDTEGVSTCNQLDLLVNMALGEGVPTDRFVFTASTVSVDTADKKTGYWDGSRALGEVAYWVTTENAGFEKAGIAICNVQNDYYSTGGACTYVKEAIDIMNPAPIK